MSQNFSKVNEFKLGQQIYGLFLVKSKKSGTTTQNKEYLDIELGDKTGSIIGKLWDVTIQAEELEVNDVAYATGKITEYMGVLQLRLDYIEKTKEKTSALDYIIQAPYSSAEMDASIERVIESFVDTEIQSLVGHLYSGHKDEFLASPAARGMHHAIYGGLGYHTVTMLKTGEALLEIYPHLNRDLLLGGIILHDLAKIFEMVSSLGNVIDYSRGGYLLGHIVQGTMMIETAAAELNISQRTKEFLQHMVVSHHEKGEWGSPQPPRVPEAILLHFIDNIDAKMYMVKELIDNVKEGEYTEYHKGLRQKLVIY